MLTLALMLKLVVMDLALRLVMEFGEVGAVSEAGLGMEFKLALE
jgi:hypothetical protein